MNPQQGPSTAHEGSVATPTPHLHPDPKPSHGESDIGGSFASNRIALITQVSAVDMGEQIETAIIRNAQLDATAIDVVVSGEKVVLSGTVQSWAERRQADQAAWSSPHVAEVYNHIIVKARVRPEVRQA